MQSFQKARLKLTLNTHILTVTRLSRLGGQYDTDTQDYTHIYCVVHNENQKHGPRADNSGVYSEVQDVASDYLTVV